MARAQTATGCGEWNADFLFQALHVGVKELHVIHVLEVADLISECPTCLESLVCEMYIEMRYEPRIIPRGAQSPRRWQERS
jgi:hypothetical protein